MTSTSDKMVEDLRHELHRADNYGRLIELQDSLIERAETGGLPRVLERKDRILRRLEQVRSEYMSNVRPPDSSAENDSLRAEELWQELTAKMEEFAGREKESIRKALSLRDWLAVQLRQVKQGKKILQSYARDRGARQARFKDIKS